MKAKNLMTQPAQTCPARMTLAAASRRMRMTGCGTLLALDAHGRLAGILTDRDLALAFRNGTDPRELLVEQAMTTRVHTCFGEDDLRTVLATMARRKVRRLPVLDDDGNVVGLVSIDDIVLWGLGSGGVRAEDLIAAFRAICATERAALDDVMQQSVTSF